MKLKHIIFWVALIIIVPKIIVSFLDVNHCNDLFDPDRTIKDCTTLIEENINPFAAYNNRAMANIMNKKYKPAIDDFTKALGLEPNNIATLNARGNAYRKNDQNDKAMDDFNQAIQINPKFADGYFNRAQLQLAMKHADKANEDVEKALEIEPNFIPAHFMKGMLLVQEGQGADAIQHLNMVITARPKMFEAYAARGIAYFYNDDFKNALRDLNTAIDNGYKDDYIYLHRGMVKLALGQSAISDFTESANNNRDKAYPVIWLHLAQARAKKDDMDDFRKNAALPYSDKWQATLIEFYLGKITEDELFAFLKTSEEPLQQTRLCEIHFYVAEMYFAKGNKDKAFENFKRAEDSCKPAALIAHLIKPELQALNTK